MAGDRCSVKDYTWGLRLGVRMRVTVNDMTYPTDLVRITLIFIPN